MGLGGAIKLTGESEYRRALDQISQKLKEVSAEMKRTSSEFDSSDRSTTALTARSRDLNNLLETQKERLSTLRAQYESFSAKVAEQASEHQKLVNEYNAEKAKLEALGNTLGTTSDEYKEQAQKVTDLANKVKDSTNANDANEKSLSNMKIKMIEAETAVNNTTKQIDNLGKETKESAQIATEASNGGWTVFKQMMADLGTKAITSVLNGLKQIGTQLVGVGKQAYQAYSEYEQYVGGVNKIFGEGAQKVLENASNAYASVGMSANKYMDTVTSFSAAITQSLGETEAAAEIADMAMRDMADNFNIFGTDIESVRSAYAGFAKDNYTMLDNLKLGYGGNATEMARLINHTKVLGEDVKVTAKTVKDVPFDKIVEAIHAVQVEIGITGTTSDEARRTIQGSTRAMQSAWQNLLVGIADDTADFDQLINNFIQTLVPADGQGGFVQQIKDRVVKIVGGIAKTIQQLLPVVIQTLTPIINENIPIVISAIQDAFTTILGAIPELMPMVQQVVSDIITNIVAMLPQVLTTGIQILMALVNGITEAIPQLVEMLPTVIKALVDTLIMNIPIIIQTGLKLLLAIIQGLGEAIPQLIDYVPEIVKTMVEVLIANLPLIIQTAVDVLVAFINGLIETLPELRHMTPTIIDTIVRTLIENLPQVITTGVRIVTSIIGGIGQTLGNLLRKAKEIVLTILDGLKSLPSEMLNVGKSLVSGIWEGISNSLSWIRYKISGWVGNVTSFIKNLFGINSPSKLFRDEIGENLALGIGEGFSDEMDDVSKQMANSIPQSFDLNPTINGSRYDTGYQYDMVSAFKQALSEMKIELDDEIAGKFVESTVSRAVYQF